MSARMDAERSSGDASEVPLMLLDGSCPRGAMVTSSLEAAGISSPEPNKIGSARRTIGLELREEAPHVAGGCEPREMPHAGLEELEPP